MNKDVPGAFLALVAGVGLGLILSKLFQQQSVPRLLLPVDPARQWNRLVMRRLKGCLDVERN